MTGRNNNSAWVRGYYTGGFPWGVRGNYGAPDHVSPTRLASRLAWRTEEAVRAGLAVYISKRGATVAIHHNRSLEPVK